jgi:UDP-N-acetylglucosamine--N-acetylmuramyl-(pentapeptide) pyrophosphoryl-undecaprenol N-acetylglucosamine transferase
MSGGPGLKNLTLVAGGTGGHIIPAMAFGDWVRRERPDVRVDYVSGSRPLELEIYRASGIEPFALGASGSPLGASGLRSLKRWCELGRGFFQMNGFMRRTSPDLCVMFGGYASAPALAVGRLRGIRSVLHEQNALAGRVTRIAAKLGVPVASGWTECAPLAEGSYRRVGVPIRRLENMPKRDAWKSLGAGDAPDGATVSVMTGSLGSETLLDALMAIAGLDDFASWGFLALDPSVNAPEKVSRNVTRIPRSWNISPFYAAADLLLTRGGASTLAEAEALGKPAVVAPWRGARDDHQMKNALAMSRSDKIRVWDERGDSPADLAGKLKNLYANFVSENGAVGKLLYNAGEASEINCRRLWNFAVDFCEGEN